MMKRLLLKIKKPLLLSLFTALTLSMLLESEKAFSLSLAGLNLWFEKMIPTLLPFMILSGILIRMNLSDSFARLFAPLLRPVFRLSDSCLYVLVIGFLCGFPMGARVTAESLQHGKLSKREASLMLAFCNNIGPIYFSGFVLTLFPAAKPLPFWAGMYLLPLLYGLFLRRMVYRDIPCPVPAAGRCVLSSASRASSALSGRSLMAQTQEAVTSALVSQASLGGYMILFNLMNLLPDLFLPAKAVLPRALCGCLLEITGGLSRLDPSDAFWAFVLLPFGGLSCIFQTYSMIRDTGLSLRLYVFHKCVQTMLAFVYYAVLFSL
ncbi:MAG TPA: hypothetical protein H9831_12430 [Candidatus Eisenbergiella pullistercoris]|uniref:Nucleoside transporter/FeoB GTPase Gate domain-containing protein n=1 Tax=Candidatus Eisenbergiella pullistercoris TaxID=2838555 RepID=A0A9D2C7H7_9FIRM|nr:hypothetical protein [Candidatus Eisenbergiella pullistercoris]